MAGGHVRRRALRHPSSRSTLSCIFDPTDQRRATQPTDSPGAAATVGADRLDRRPARPTAPPPRHAAADRRAPEWDGKDRLNILLIGADQRPKEGTFNTDTMIVVSIDPVDEPGRDVQPAARHRRRADARRGRRGSVFGSTYAGKINSLWTQRPEPADAFPGNARRTRLQRASRPSSATSTASTSSTTSRSTSTASSRSSTRSAASRSTSRSRSWTITTPATTAEPRAGSTSRPASSTWTAPRRSIYARSRHTSTDFDRAQRQQRVLLSLREQVEHRRQILAEPDAARSKRSRPRSRPTSRRTSCPT